MSDGLVPAIMAALATGVFVFFCLLIGCTGYWKTDESDYQIDRIDSRDMLLQRENLADTELEDGKTEWQCIVCVHMNHPDQKTCNLCGAANDSMFLENIAESVDNSTVILGRTLLHNTFLRSSTLSPRGGGAGGDCGTEGRTSSSASTLYNGSFLGSMDTAVMNGRQRALRYRRLNQMQLTQKQRGASRRRLWQRVLLPNGTFVWVRTTEPPFYKKSDSFVSKLRNNTFLTKNPHAHHLRGTVAEQLRRKNAATLGFFSEFNEKGELAWRKTEEQVVIEMGEGAGAPPPSSSTTAKTGSVSSQSGYSQDILLDPTMDFEGLMSMTFREKKKWFLKRVGEITVPYMESLFKIVVRRSHILEDSVASLAGYMAPIQLREHLNISFVDEPALDAGGVQREWFMLVCRELFSSDRGLFLPTHAESLSYWINPASSKLVDDHLKYYTFAGRLFGKAIMEGLVFEANMALPLLKHFLGVPITFSDLEFLDEELHRSCVWIRDHEGVDTLCVTFSVQDEGGEVVELKPNGAEIDVTDENKMEYLSLLLRYRMLGSVSQQLAAMISGLYEVIPKQLLSVFDYQELDFFICGLPEINLKDWQMNTLIRHFAGDSDVAAIEREIEVIWWFWEVVSTFSDEELARLLQFSTGSTRVPVEGFKALTSASGYIHPFTLQLVLPDTPPIGLFPRAHTCFNRLDLPIYRDKEELKTYLTLVLQMEITGFGFE